MINIFDATLISDIVVYYHLKYITKNEFIASNLLNTIQHLYVFVLVIHIVNHRVV